MTALTLLALGMGFTLGAMLLAFGVPWAKKRTVSKQDPVQNPVPLPEAPTVPAHHPSENTCAKLDPTQIMPHYYALALGVDTVPTEIAAKYRGVVKTISHAVELHTKNPVRKLHRPALLPRLLHAVNDDDLNRQALVQIVAQDPALVGNLLRLANSPLYRIGHRPIESIERAVVVLGTSGIRSLISAAMMQPAVLIADDPGCSEFPRITWEQATRSAIAAEAHAAAGSTEDGFAAQLLGLLLGVGDTLVFRIAMDCFADAKLAPMHSVTAAALEHHSARVAYDIATQWELSERFCGALDNEVDNVKTEVLPPLARSLRFGRLTGMLATLAAYGRVDETSAHNCLKHLPTAIGFNVENLWTRLRKENTDADSSAHEPGAP